MSDQSGHPDYSQLAVLIPGAVGRLLMRTPPIFVIPGTRPGPDPGGDPGPGLASSGMTSGRGNGGVARLF